MKRMSKAMSGMVGPRWGPPEGMPWALLCVAQDGPVRPGDRLVYDTQLRCYRCGDLCVHVWRAHAMWGVRYQIPAVGKKEAA